MNREKPAPVKAAVKRSFVSSLDVFGLEPVEHFGRVFKKAWSIRLNLLAGFFAGLEIALPILDQWIVIPRGLFAAMSGFTAMASTVARLVAQRSVSNPPKDEPNADTAPQPKV
ncbi:hypothetical protein [Neorhizobium sp. NCHU2750]|uniref:DUF7940 domain-containing protein n=1 Tax=Neorhizobium sp. NCHU2750 TaxID=1825976 RepID=UPI000EB66A43|nr:hypothetical protein NCHU2750_06400 [Neorhizobium sp. NCHU2750]